MLSHAFLSLCVPFVAFFVFAQELEPVINIGHVSFLGNATSPAGEENSSVHFFGGIPYAQPPLRQLRFKAPQPLVEDSSINFVRDSRNWGPPCIQQPAVVGVGSEDCLLLNVWKPSRARQGDNLPVVVYIYGGGFYYGTTQGFPMYDWVEQSQAVIAVSVGYRLNMFGFLNSPSMDREDLNAGLLDQRAALEWIQRHISKFGGNPGAVTIVGESAGGASTVMQIVAYGGTKPAPFARAISQSIGYGPTPTEQESAAALRNATRAAGCPETGNDALNCLKRASLGALVAGINHVTPGKFAPIVSGPGTILPELPASLIRSGNFSVVDYIGGHCTNDGRSFTSGSPTTLVTEDQVIFAILKRWPSLTNRTLDRILEFYPSPKSIGSPFATEYNRAWVIEQDAVFGCMDWFMAKRISELGGKNIFTYQFNSPDPVLYNVNPYLGVMHTSDLFFLFDGTNTAPNAGYTFKPFNETEALLSEEIIAYWTSFARTGNPSLHKRSFSPHWSGLEAGKAIVMTRGDESTNTTATTLEDISTEYMERCLFWMGKDITEQTRL